ncbi:outer membrane protein [Taklimakanibacter deserti]|uniref:outer membrane protein n=1 Tax=Taklimakanibacter deserti TaxID=2267839 RepID=UPI0013C421A3
MLKRIVSAGAGLLVSLSAAQAADIETFTAHDWSGPYIGIQAGYGWGESDANTELDQSVVVLAASQPITLFPAEEGSIDAEGVLGGLHAGYNLESGNLVLGIEADAELSDMDGDTDVLFETDEPFAKQEKEFDWLASLRLRAGYAMDRVLIYATGGVALADVDMSFKLLDGSFDESDTEIAFGITVGGGLEYALTDNLTLRAEYRYTDLEDTSFSGMGKEFCAKYKYENDFHAVRGGLSWYF